MVLLLSAMDLVGRGLRRRVMTFSVPESCEIRTVGPLAMGYAMASRGALGFGSGPWPPGLGRAQIMLGSGPGSWPLGLDRGPIVLSAPFGGEMMD